MLGLDTTHKTCAKCSNLLEITNFRPRKPGSHLYQSYCKPCEREHWRNWRERNKSNEIIRLREYYKNNKKRILNYKKENRIVNHDLFVMREKKNRDRRGDLNKILSKKWRDANLDKVRVYSHTNNAKRKNAKAYAIKTIELIALRKKPCFECGATNKIHIDHIIPIIKGGNHSIGNLMPLCANCNLSKGSKTYMEWRVWKMKNVRKS